MSVGKLAAALANIAGECGVILKTGDNTHQRYTYASDSDLKKQLQPLFAKYGITIVPRGIDATWDEAKQKNATAARCRMQVTYTIAHESGEMMQAVAFGEGINNGDKAAYVAQTGAYKYLVRTIFAVPTTDDAEQASPAVVPQHAPAGEGHDQDFSADQGSFFAALNDVGCDYEDVKAFAQANDQPKPSSAGNKGRRQLVEYLRSEKGKADFLGFLESAR
ncbi:hypothetical protein LCGC14_0436530 [marine sediment metagenome]|uniref:Single-stranded DNA-binding protein n=1 Tax=marine sediment metagenome TaxID=412755 RepID=A0A0F9SSQ5_9ZZZZ